MEETPFWLQIVWAVAAPLIVALICWTAATFLKIRSELAKQRRDSEARFASLEKDIAAIHQRCASRIELSTGQDRKIDGLTMAIHRIDRNIIRIGAKAKVDELENWNG